MARIDNKAGGNPYVVVCLLLLLLACPALVMILPGNTGMLVLCLVLPAAGITLGFITNNVGKDRKYNHKS
ncbi:MAG: hypothetical protein ACM3PE_05430 [Deltaproteobacteria bacterium]